MSCSTGELETDPTEEFSIGSARQTKASLSSEAESSACNEDVSWTLFSPVAGTVTPLGKLPDPVFSSGMLGAGIAIDPDEGHVVAPCDGTVTMLAQTGHAICLRSDEGAEILVHIGLDTVSMKGAGFCLIAKKGQHVRHGEPLLDFDKAAIMAAGHPSEVILVVTNSHSLIYSVGEGTRMAKGDLLAVASGE